MNDRIHSEVIVVLCSHTTQVAAVSAWISDIVLLVYGATCCLSLWTWLGSDLVCYVTRWITLPRRPPSSNCLLFEKPFGFKEFENGNECSKRFCKNNVKNWLVFKFFSFKYQTQNTTNQNIYPLLHWKHLYEVEFNKIRKGGNHKDTCELKQLYRESKLSTW